MNKLFITAFAALLLSGCASIVGSPQESVSFNSNIENATMVLKNKKNMVVYSGKLPMTLSLKKKAGFFSGETYTASVRKTGYASQEQILDTGLSGWYWGNILFGGLIGMLIVDPATGSMWTFDTDNVFINLSEKNQLY